MNSIGKIIDGFEWTYNGPISMARGTGFDGKGISRTLFLSPNLADIPAQLFAVKISQSKNAAKAGKTVFKWFSFRIGSEAKFENIVPEGVSIETPLEEIRNLVVSKLNNIPDSQVSLSINMPGRFTNIATADGEFAIYDANNEAFQTDDPKTTGNAPYYVKSDAIMTVHLKGATSQNNEYFQTTISTTASANDIFAKSAVGKVWGEEDAPASTVSASTEGGSVW